MALHLAVAGDFFDDVLFCLSCFPRDVLDEIWTELSQFLRIFLPTPLLNSMKAVCVIFFYMLAIILFLFYPITLEGRRGTTDEFATIPFHLDLFSAAPVELAKSIPVHSLILSSHLFFCLPLFLFPFTVP